MAVCNLKKGDFGCSRKWELLCERTAPTPVALDCVREGARAREGASNRHLLLRRKRLSQMKAAATAKINKPPYKIATTAQRDLCSDVVNQAGNDITNCVRKKAEHKTIVPQAVSVLIKNCFILSSPCANPVAQNSDWLVAHI